MRGVALSIFVVVAGAAAAAACSSFGTGSPSPTTNTTTGGTDAGGDASVDATAPPTDADVPVDSQDAGPACGSNIPLFGSDSITSTVNDGIPEGFLDVYGYRGAGGIAAQQARCVWVYLDDSSAATSVLVGVYSSSNDYPNTLVAQATINGAKRGWNSAVLNQEVTVGPGTVLFIGVRPNASENVVIRVLQGCPTTAYRRISLQPTPRTLPSTMPTDAGGGAECNAAVYLSR